MKETNDASKGHSDLGRKLEPSSAKRGSNFTFGSSFDNNDELALRMISLSSEQNHLNWDKVVDLCPWGKFFHHSVWLQFLEKYGKTTGDFKPRHLCLNMGGDMVGAFPVFITPKAHGISLPYGDYGGPVIVSNCGDVGEAAKRLFEGALAWNLRSIRAKSVPQLIHPALRATGFSVKPHMSTYLLNLAGKQPQDLLSSVRRDARRGIRAAQHNGVTIVEASRHGSEDPATYLDLHKETVRRISAPERRREFFEFLWEDMVEPGIARVTFAECDSSRVAGLICLIGKGKPRTLHIYSNVSGSRASDLHANDLLYWEAIEWANEHGFDLVDMGLSPLNPHESLCLFKQKWGAEQHTIHFADRATRIERIRLIMRSATAKLAQTEKS